MGPFFLLISASGFPFSFLFFGGWGGGGRGGSGFPFWGRDVKVFVAVTQTESVACSAIVGEVQS